MRDLILQLSKSSIYSTKPLLVKDLKNRYEIKPLIECGDKLNQYQIIKYCIRVFVDRDIKERVTPEIIYKINEIVVKQIALLN
ncbi:phosphohydrolase, partial [Klebsiella pneumoniae]|nr:phosphohydrolase [Klebsiella pneumoniae]